MKKSYPKSPCIGVCIYNENKICQGCLRTSSEITSWRSLNQKEKEKIWEKINEKKTKNKETIFLKDQLKRIIKISFPIKNIISFDPFIKNSICELGLEKLLTKDKKKAEIIFIDKKDFSPQDDNKNTWVADTSSSQTKEKMLELLYKILPNN